MLLIIKLYEGPQFTKNVQSFRLILACQIIWNEFIIQIILSNFF